MKYFFLTQMHGLVYKLIMNTSLCLVENPFFWSPIPKGLAYWGTSLGQAIGYPKWWALEKVAPAFNMAIVGIYSMTFWGVESCEMDLHSPKTNSLPLKMDSSKISTSQRCSDKTQIPETNPPWKIHVRFFSHNWDVEGPCKWTTDPVKPS